ncbi:MAG: MerR family transcriptional regulator, partial [Myxococcales bacterium]
GAPHGEKTYRIQAAAERAGLSVEVIRAWERRYRLLQPQRTPGGYRVYTETDVALLRRIRALLDEGMAISEAARLAPAIRQELEARREAVEAPPVLAWRKRLLDEAHALDQPAVEQTLDETLSALHPVDVLQRIILPVQREMGAQWEDGKALVAHEHLLTQSLRERVISMLHGAPRGNAGHVLLACFPDEQHELGLLAVALRCRHAGLRVTLLGQSTPIEEVAHVASALRVDAIGLSTVFDTGEAKFRVTVEALCQTLPAGTQVVIGGPASRPYSAVCDELGLLANAGDDDIGPLLSCAAAWRTRGQGRRH